MTGYSILQLCSAQHKHVMNKGSFKCYIMHWRGGEYKSGQISITKVNGSMLILALAKTYDGVEVSNLQGKNH